MAEVAEQPKPRTLAAELSAEFAGTMILILFGVGVVAQVVAQGNGEAQSIHWAWGLGVTLGVYTAARVSGAHLNPAVTIALAAFRGFSWSKVAPYALAQTLGAFVAALLVRWNYSEAINALDPDKTFDTQGIFSTLPGANIDISGAFRDQVIGTAILMFLILAVTDVRGTAPIANLGPFIVGLIVVAIGMSWGANAGYAINPARDFGPRFMSYLTGYGTAFREPGGDFYFWVPIVAPVIGALIGAAIYDGLIGRYLPLGDDDAEPGRTPSDPDVDASDHHETGDGHRHSTTGPTSERTTTHG